MRLSGSSDFPSPACYTDSILDLDRTGRIALAAAAIFVLLQVIGPPVVGLADNGDFAKIMGRFGLRPAIDSPQDAFFGYANTRYLFDPSSVWRSGFVSVGVPLASLAVGAARLFGGGAFDIRFLGLLHAALYLAAFALALPLLRRYRAGRRAALAAFILLVFCDVMYVSSFNSFYTDTPALLFFLLAAVFFLRGVHIPRSKPPAGPLFLLSACLFLLSKAQHAPLAAILAPLALFVPPGLLALPSRPLLSRALAAALLAACGWYSLDSPPKNYTSPALFTVIFYSLLPIGDHPSADLRELGLDDSYLAYRGLHAYSAGSPLPDPAWRDRFLAATSYGKLALFYLRHPLRAAASLGHGLDGAAIQRPENLGNLDRSQGHPPEFQTARFALWSGLKSRLFDRIGPAYLLYFLLLLALAAQSGPLSAALLGALALLSLGIAALADAGETTRHLFLFNAMVDLAAVGAAASLLGGSNPPESPRVE